MKSDIAKRSIAIVGHKTSISLEEPYWAALRDIARMRNMSLGALVHEIDMARERPNLSSAIRLFVLDHYRARCARPPGFTVAESPAPAEGPASEVRASLQHALARTSEA